MLVIIKFILCFQLECNFIKYIAQDFFATFYYLQLFTNKIIIALIRFLKGQCTFIDISTCTSCKCARFRPTG